MGGTRVLVISLIAPQIVRRPRPTMTSGLDPGDLQNLFKMVWDKVTNSQTDIFESSIHDQVLEDGPQLSNLALLSDIGRVDQEQVGPRAESIKGALDRFLDILEFGWEV